MSDSHIFYAKNRFLYPSVIWLISLMLVITSTDQTWLPALSWAVFLGYVSYLIFVRPAVLVSKEAITIRNPYLTKTFGWKRVELVDVRFSLFVQVAGKRHQSWAALAPSRYHNRRVARGDVRGISEPRASELRFSEAPNSETGAIVYLSRQWLEHPIGSENSVKLDWKALAVTLVLAVLAITAG
jgi:hypothetical protein